MLLTLYDKSNNQKMEIEPSDSSTWTKAVQSDNVLSLSFVLYECITLEVNDYIDLYGERFWLIDRYTPKQKSSVEWEYNIKLYGIESLIKRYLVVKLVNGDNETEFSYTATAYDHVALIVQNINAGMETSSWKVGEVVTSELLVIDYEGTYCNDGLKKVAELTGVEYWVEGTTVNVSRCEHGELLTLGYGKGLTSIYSDKADNVKFFTRLFPIGSTRNISYDDYGHSRLQLPSGVKYIDQDTDKFGIVHHYEKEAFENIYPRRIGKVSNVRSKEVKGESGNPFTIYYFKDDSLSFNPNDYEMNGLVKMVSFQDNSSLAGRDFEVNYNDKTKEFEIITQWPYDNDIQIPNEQLSPKVLDEYILWNIKMPIEYYALAEVEYQDAVKKYMAEQRQDVAVYKAHTDYIDIDDPNIDIRVGRRVRLEHSQYFAEGYRNSRITKITRKVVRPMDMDIEISDALSKGAIESIKDSVDKVTDDNRESIENVRKESLQFTQRRYRDAIETMEMLSAALLDNFTNSITPISVQTMQLILGDESLQFILTTSKTKPDNNIITPNFFFDTEDAGRFKVDFRATATVYLQHKTLGIDSLSSSHTDFKTWRMAEFTSAPLTDANKSYYLYAKVSTTNVPDAQVFYLSETAIGINDVEGYHHLLVGVLNREIDGERSFSSLYGFAELTPGRLTIPLISSPDGGTYFDLVTGEIAGQITFKAGSKGLKDVEEWAGVESDINSAQDAADAAQAAADKGVSDAADALAKALKAEADAANSVADYNAKFALQQAQIDGEVSNWYYPYKPTLSNAPASSWANNAERDRHIGDTFLNTQPYVDDKTTPDAGKAWRWVKNGTVYSWTAISDSDAVKALQEAAKALATADGKSTTFVLTGTTTPKTYDLGDMWVLQSDTVHTPNKQGEVLFSTTNRTNQYVAADWVTKVRYTDDTAIKELQIGGVNLIRYNNTAVNDAWVGFYSIVSVSPDKIIRGTSNVVTTGWPRIANNIGKYITAFDLTKQYTISFYARANDALNSLLAISDPSDSNKAYGTSLSLTSQWQYFSLTFIPLKQIVAATYLMIYCGKTGVPDTTSWVELKDVQLEQGNKATSWTPAVADVQFEIDVAQSAANQAIADLATINSDKIVSPPEKPALKAQWDMLLSEKASIDKSAELYLLTGSTEYQNYVTGSGKAIAAYAKYSNTAIKDIPITADYADISTYQNYKKAILNKIEEAIKAVQDAIKDQADKAQAVAEALNYLKAALKDGKVEVGSEGVNGVLLGNILGVVPPSQEGKYLLSNMRAGMSGIENDKLAFFAHPTDAYNTARKYVNGESIIRPNFAVTDQGQLIANDVDIKGKIEATIGVIGGFTINGSSIYSDNLTINNTFIRYKTSNNDRLVMFGTGTTPPSTAQNITARIENKVWANIASRSNVGLYVECSGIQNPYADSGRNIAIQAIGEVNITCPPTNGSRALIVNGITDLNNQLTVNGTTFINGELHVYGTVWFHNVPRQSTDRALYVNTGSGLIHRA